MTYNDTDMVEVTLSEEEYLRLPKEALKLLSLAVTCPTPDGLKFKMPGHRLKELMKITSLVED